MRRDQHRRGVMLIVVVGFAAMLMAVAWSFFGRMRADAQESDLVVNEAQARIMLHAGLNYIQEASRMGWHDPTSGGIMLEAFGWTDVRDGAVGPRDQFKRSLWTDTSRFPEPGGRAARFDMYVMVQPPSAMRPDMAPNPMGPPPAAASNPDAWFTSNEAGSELSFRMPNLPRAPVSSNFELAPLSGNFRTDTAVDFHYGDQNPLPNSQGKAWFRIYRELPAEHDGVPGNVTNAGRSDEFDVVDLTDHHSVFIITCGAGGSMGFRDWSEVQAYQAETGELPFDRLTYENLRATERILWYRVEWSASVLPGTFSDTIDSRDNLESHLWTSHVSLFNTLSRKRAPPRIWRNAPMEGGSVAKNPVGTIDWIMRLEREPPNW